MWPEPTKSKMHVCGTATVFWPSEAWGKEITSKHGWGRSYLCEQLAVLLPLRGDS